jgi:hypothetical protein
MRPMVRRPIIALKHFRLHDHVDSFRMPTPTNGVALSYNRPEFPSPILRAYC